MLSNNIDRTPEGVLTFAGYDVTQLAKEYGTPLYLMDEARIRANCRMYLQAFRDRRRIFWVTLASAAVFSSAKSSSRLSATKKPMP